MLNLNKVERNWNNYDFSKKSLAVIASNEKGEGVVLWSVGGHIKMEMEECGLRYIQDLGISPPASGIYVWEGKYIWSPGSYEHPEDGEMNPVGTFRLPTEEEWVNIKLNECPWNDSEWKLR